MEEPEVDLENLGRIIGLQYAMYIANQSVLALLTQCAELKECLLETKKRELDRRQDAHHRELEASRNALTAK